MKYLRLLILLMMLSWSSLLNGQVSFQIDLLEPIKKANAIYLWQSERINTLENLAFELEYKIKDVTLAHEYCRAQVKEYKAREINYSLQLEYKDGIIKEKNKVIYVAYGISGALLTYILYTNLK